jgi:hypothetical protein
MRYRLGTLTEADTAAYIEHRMRQAGAPGSPFSADAVVVIHLASEGTPRAINTICDNALFEAYLAGSKQIDAELVQRVSDNLGLIVGPLSQPSGSANGKGPPPRPALDLAEIDQYLEGLRKS